MRHITELSTQEIYSGLRHFYTPSLLPRNTFFQMERKEKELHVQC